MKNRHPLLSFINCRCPKCREGRVFTHSLFSFKDYKKTNVQCGICGQVFEVEPGFFWGAIYVGYALNVGLGVVLGFLLYRYFNDPPIWVYLTTIISSMLLAVPINYRYGRMVMLYIFGSIQYQPLD